MNCVLVDEALVDFHFGYCDDAKRARVEAHLFSCPGCLQAYFEFKRAVEHGERSTESPSSSVRTRLRASVAEAFGPPARPVPWWRPRPSPSWRGLGVVAVAAACGLVFLLHPAHRPPRDTGAHAEGRRVDTSRRTPENRNVY